jgi:hypothetical protein
VPPERWTGHFRPDRVLGDTTWYLFNYEPDCNVPFWFDLAVDDHLIVTAAGNAIEVRGLSQPSFDGPTGELCQPVLGPWRKTDRDFYVTTVVLSQGSDLAALGLLGGMGFVLVDLAQPSSPRVLYQDENPVDVTALDTGVVAGREVVYALASDRSIAVYDLAEARALRADNQVCYEARGERDCARAIHRGALKDGSGQVLQTIQVLEAVDDAVVIGTPGSPLRLLSVSTIAGPSPGQQLQAQECAQIGQWGWDVELWPSQGNSGSAFTTGILDGQQVTLFEVVLSGGRESTRLSQACSAVTVTLPVLATPGPMAANGSAVSNDRLRHSRDGVRDYLFVGRSVTLGVGPGAEYLYDVTDPAAPVLLSADTTSPEAVDATQQGYWGWYYPQNPTGFRSAAPRSGVVQGDVLYRAGRSILDSHAVLRSGVFSDGFETAGVARWSDTVSR